MSKCVIRLWTPGTTRARDYMTYIPLDATEEQKAQEDAEMWNYKVITNSMTINLWFRKNSVFKCHRGVFCAQTELKKKGKEKKRNFKKEKVLIWYFKNVL